MPCILLYNKGGVGPEGTQITKVCTNVHTCMYICHLAPPMPFRLKNRHAKSIKAVKEKELYCVATYVDDIGANCGKIATLNFPKLFLNFVFFILNLSHRNSKQLKGPT